MSEWMDVAAVSDFPSGSFRMVTAGDMSILVVNLNGRFYAVENICTHEYAQLSEGKLQGDHVICPLHGAHFSVVTGEALTAPAYENLRTFPVRVANGWVEVDAEAEWDIA